MPSLAAHAKVNLFLHVLARETSGYHQIETLFCRIDLSDTVSIEPGPRGIRLEVDGVLSGDPRDNLVHRAATAFCERTGRQPAFRIRLVKRIPVGAGLGGGSSDAATTLHLLNEMHGAPLTRGEVVALGAGLGSDVPFFCTRADLALAWGRGERLLRLDPLPALPMLIAVPPRSMPTAQAYVLLADRRPTRGRNAGQIDPAREVDPHARLIETGSLASWDGVAGLAGNDFDAVVPDLIPDLGGLRDAMRQGGARIAMLAGSGSAMFGVFDDTRPRDDAAAAIRTRFRDARVIETASAGPPER